MQSHPSWVRGLKYLLDVYQDSLLKVAPLVGAWIEINSFHIESVGKFVAPLVGAWIEIWLSSDHSGITVVAPLVGAWIEMSLKRYL